jgi:hypothetical protein
MKKDMPLEGLRWSRDSGSALYDTPQTAVLGRAGGGLHLFRQSPLACFFQSFCGRRKSAFLVPRHYIDVNIIKIVVRLVFYADVCDSSHFSGIEVIY